MNDCFESVRSIQRYYNRTGIFQMDYGLFNHIQSCIFCRLKLLFNFYVKRTVRRQDFGAKFNLAYHNGTPVADILKHPKSKIKNPFPWYIYRGKRIERVLYYFSLPSVSSVRCQAVSKICSLLEWCFTISIDTCWD